MKEVSMENPRPEKVAVVEEVREKLSQTEAVVFTEYRGLTVRDLQDLRGALAAAGGEYKVYKNTLVRRATAELDLDLGETLTGPTALALVANRPDGTPGDAVLVAKALKAFAKGNPNLVLRVDDSVSRCSTPRRSSPWRTWPPVTSLLARLAGGMAAPMTNMARLLQALPQKFAYALSALIADGGGAADEVAEGGGAAGSAVADEVTDQVDPTDETDPTDNDEATADADASTDDGAQGAESATEQE
ncbi:MAG: 50S ribosomal protein L10 [Microthrixaceae bacterium]|nr:50S ribosomal protein L10 [Microthrixaceae bacterium]